MTSYRKGESDLPEAPEKWLCGECGKTFKKALTAANPFDPNTTITGCPHCKQVEHIYGACQVGDCERHVDSGHPGGHGYRYIWTCREHSPKE